MMCPYPWGPHGAPCRELEVQRAEGPESECLRVWTVLGAEKEGRDHFPPETLLPPCIPHAAFHKTSVTFLDFLREGARRLGSAWIRPAMDKSTFRLWDSGRQRCEDGEKG